MSLLNCVPYILTCPRAWRVYVITANVPAYLRAHVPSCFFIIFDIIISII